MTSRVGSVAVVGAGIAGLAAAWRLWRRGVDVTVYEARATVGGFIGTVRENGFLIEAGPASLRGDRGAVGSLVRELGLATVDASAAAKARFVWAKGKLMPLPSSPPALLKSELLSLRGKLELLSEPFKKVRVVERETLAGLLRRRIGAEAVAMLVDPFVTGVYAGDPEQLGVDAFPLLGELERDFGSIFMGLRARGFGGGIYSLKDGLGALPAAIAGELGDRVRLGQTLSTIEGLADQVIVATDARAAAQLVDAPTLAEIPHAPIVRVEIGLNSNDLVRPLEGFGLLCASSSPLPEVGRVMGIVFSSSVFPGRAPSGQRSFSVMLGGVRDPDVATTSESDLVARATKALDVVMGLRGAPTMTHVSRWARAIPQYLPGHLAAMARVREALPKAVHLAGNYLEGPSVDAAAASGFAAADAVFGFEPTERREDGERKHGGRGAPRRSDES